MCGGASATLFRSLSHTRAVLEAWRADYNDASQHPSVYVLEEKRFCCSGCDLVGYFGFLCARSVIARAGDSERTARLKIQGPSGKGCIASISAASLAFATHRTVVVVTVHESGAADAIRGKEMIIAAPFVARGAMVPMRLEAQEERPRAAAASVQPSGNG
jgi:hypothetical protein